MRERLNTPRAAWSLTRTEVINRFRFVFSGEIYRSSYWMILHFWDKPKEWKCHWTMWQKAQSQRHFGAPWKADTTSCVKITNGTTLFYSDLKNSSLFHKKHTFNGHLFYISEECECLWGPCVCVWKTDADREGKNLMFKQCSIILSVLTPLSIDAFILWLKLWFWCEHFYSAWHFVAKYTTTIVFFFRYTFWPPTSVAFPLHTIKVQNTPRTHIEDKSSACCLRVWHQIPFIRDLQRLQNPPDELNHCLCLFTWYVTYKCTKYKTFKDKCFTQKEENFLSNQSKCYGFQLRCNCKV